MSTPSLHKPPPVMGRGLESHVQTSEKRRQRRVGRHRRQEDENKEQNHLPSKTSTEAEAHGGTQGLSCLSSCQQADHKPSAPPGQVTERHDSPQTLTEGPSTPGTVAQCRSASAEGAQESVTWTGPLRPHQKPPPVPGGGPERDAGPRRAAGPGDPAAASPRPINCGLEKGITSWGSCNNPELESRGFWELTGEAAKGVKQGSPVRGAENLPPGFSG